MADAKNIPAGSDNITLYKKLPWEEFEFAVKVYIRVYSDWIAHAKKQKKSKNSKKGPKLGDYLWIFKTEYSATSKYNNNRYMKSFINDTEKKQYNAMCENVKQIRKDRIKQVKRETGIDTTKLLDMKHLDEATVKEHGWIGYPRGTPPTVVPKIKKKRRSSGNEDNKMDIDINIQTEKKEKEKKEKEKKEKDKKEKNKKEKNKKESDSNESDSSESDSDVSESNDDKDQEEQSNASEVNIMQIKQETIDLTSPERKETIETETATNDMQQEQYTDYDNDYDTANYIRTIDGLKEELQVKVNRLGDRSIQCLIEETLNARPRNEEYDKLFIDMMDRVSKAYLSVGTAITGSGISHFDSEKALNIIRSFVKIKSYNSDILQWLDLWMDLFTSYDNCLSNTSFSSKDSTNINKFGVAIRIKKGLILTPLNTDIIEKQSKMNKLINDRKKSKQKTQSAEEKELVTKIKQLKRNIEPYKIILSHYEQIIKDSLQNIWEKSTISDRYGLALFFECGYNTATISICNSFLINTCLNGWAAESDGIWKSIVFYFNSGLNIIKHIISGEILLLIDMAKEQNFKKDTVQEAERYFRILYNCWNRLSKIKDVHSSTSVSLVLETLQCLKTDSDCLVITNNIKSILADKRKVTTMKKLYINSISNEWLILKLLSPTTPADKSSVIFNKLHTFEITKLSGSLEALVEYMTEPVKIAPPRYVGTMEAYPGIDYIEITADMSSCMYYSFYTCLTYPSCPIYVSFLINI